MSDETTNDGSDADVREDVLDGLDTETVEDLDVGDEADDVRGGTTWHCMDDGPHLR